MQKQPSKAQRAYAVTGAFITWFAILLQFVLIIIDRKISILSTVVQFFSYFTILTNILVAIGYTKSILNKPIADKSFFTNPATLAAVTVYITVVGLVYNLVLRQLWQPEGIRKLADELLHLVSPILFLFYWILFVPKQQLQWKNIFPWLIYPAVYLAYVLLRGAITGLYPYPFMEVDKLGYSKVWANCGLVCLAFLACAIIFMGIAKLSTRLKP